MARDSEYALEHKTRRMIYQYILEHPGTSFGGIRRMFDLTVGTLRYHLKYLRKADKIASKLVNGRKCYYSSETSRTLSSSLELNSSVYNNTQKHILHIIRNNPGITRKELSKKTRIKKDTLAYNIRKFIDEGLIWKVRRDGYATGYEYITQEKLNSEVITLLMERYLNGEIQETTFLALMKKLKER